MFSPPPSLRLRVKAPSGKMHIIVSDDNEETLGNFLHRASDLCNISSAVDILIGYPPSICTSDHSQLLSNIVTTGDSVMLRLADIQPFRGWQSIDVTAADNADATAVNYSVVESTQKRTLTSSSYIESRPLIVIDDDDEVEEDVVVVVDESESNSCGAWDHHAVSPWMKEKKQRLNLPKNEWVFVRLFELYDEFKKWKSFDEVKWLAGTHANHKIDGHSSYQNFKCKSHADCKAQVSFINQYVCVSIINLFYLYH